LNFGKQKKIPNVSEKRRGEKWAKEDKEEQNDKNGKLDFDNPPGKKNNFLKCMKFIYLKKMKQV
jgi:hypothetical protein